MWLQFLHDVFRPEVLAVYHFYDALELFYSYWIFCFRIVSRDVIESYILKSEVSLSNTVNKLVHRKFLINHINKHVLMRLAHEEIHISFG